MLGTNRLEPFGDNGEGLVPLNLFEDRCALVVDLRRTTGLRAIRVFVKLLSVEPAGR